MAISDTHKYTRRAAIVIYYYHYYYYYYYYCYQHHHHYQHCHYHYQYYCYRHCTGQSPESLLAPNKLHSYMIACGPNVLLPLLGVPATRLYPETNQLNDIILRLSKIRLNVSFPSTSRSFKWPYLLDFLTECNIFKKIKQIMNLNIMQVSAC
jgi:hypothetical protein